MNKFDNDFEYYTELIKSNNNFAYSRYADGEVQLMKGNSIGHQSQAYMVDRWTAPSEMTTVGLDLLESLEHTEENYHYAISGINDNISDYEFLTERIKNKNLTFANLWINANYQKMKFFYQNLKKQVYLVCNQKAVKENFPFSVAEIFPFPDNCVKYWETYGEDYITQLGDYVSQLQNQTFFISCGPVSEIIIDKLYKLNPNNQYIDVGSSIDEFVHGYPTRPYMDPNSQYAKEISYFKSYKHVTKLEDLKVFIPTCNKYLPVVEALMYTINKYWPANNKFIILGYEPPTYNLNPNWSFVSLGVDTGPGNWSNDLIKFFNTFEEEYFINMIDDTLLTRMSDISKIEIVFNYMRRYKEVKKCFLHGSLSSGDKSLLGNIELTPVEELSGLFYDINQIADYRTSIQSAIWSTKYFLHNLKPNMNPWQFETQHTKNDGARILTTINNHPTMISHLYRIGNQLQPDWYKSVFENTQLPDEDIIYIKKLLNI
jgi:hypothetical protein